MEYLVQFLYAGNIPCDNEKISCQILDNLNKVFGFPDSMVLALPNNAGICTINVEKNEVPVEMLVKKTENEDEITIDTNDVSDNIEPFENDNVETADLSTTTDISIEDHNLDSDSHEDFNKTSAFPRNELPKFYECQYCNLSQFETFSQLNDHVSTVHPFLSTVIIPDLSNDNRNLSSPIEAEPEKLEWATNILKSQTQVFLDL